MVWEFVPHTCNPQKSRGQAISSHVELCPWGRRGQAGAQQGTQGWSPSSSLPLPMLHPILSLFSVTKCQFPTLACFTPSLQAKCPDKSKAGKGSGWREGLRDFLILVRPRLGPCCSQMPGVWSSGVRCPSGSSVAPGASPGAPSSPRTALGFWKHNVRLPFLVISYLLILKKSPNPISSDEYLNIY